MTGGTLIDVLLALGLLAYALNGWRQGFVVSALSLLGFLGAGALALWLLPALLGQSSWVQEHEVVRVVALVVGVFVVASVGQGVMVQVGSRVRSRVRWQSVKTLDSMLGAVAVVSAVSVLLWFVAGALRPAAPAPLARAIGESRVLGAIDTIVPSQTGRLFAGFRATLDRSGFPRVFDGLSPEPIAPVRPPDATAGATAAVRK
ncbi:MAG: CvpA family protein, partial [Actinomycetota bacterium]|nr:CvpA family protein [Actinomycetota bacterium]